METINIICVDDQPEVLDSVLRDLRPLSPLIRLEEASGTEDCLRLLEQIDEDGGHVAVLITDQVMPGNTGTDLLAKVTGDARFSHTRKILLTGQATHADTINAINEGRLDNYVEKPWEPEKLLNMVKRLLTLYIMEAGIDYKPYMSILDNATLFSKLR